MLLLLCLILCSTINSREYRSFSGHNNSLLNPSFGQVGSPYSRHQGPPSYANGSVDGVDDTLPSARLISNIMAQSSLNGVILEPNFLSMMHNTWGFLISLDLGSMASDPAYGVVNTAADPSDPDYDPNWAGVLSIARSVPVAGTGNGTTNPKQMINTQTHWLDGSIIYGQADDQASWFWEPTTGNLKIVEDSNGFLILGDIRTNFVPGTRYLIELFQRVHNSYVAQLRANMTGATPVVLYQEARRLVIAHIQSITFRDYLPGMIGTYLDPYQRYDDTTDPSIDAVFSVTTGRVGHSATRTEQARLENDQSPCKYGGTLLRDTLLNPNSWKYPDPNNASKYTHQPECYFRGLSYNLCTQLDGGYTNDLRNFLSFGLLVNPPASRRSGVDLFVIDLLRSRDTGIPSYNVVRQNLGLSALTQCSELTPDPIIAQAICDAYGGNISRVEALVGALLEQRAGIATSALAADSHIEQFTRLRDGDRFWYESSYFTDAEREYIYSKKLSHLILEHYPNVTGLPENIFFTQERGFQVQTVLFPEPPQAQTLPWRFKDLAPTFRVSWYISGDIITFLLQVYTNGWVGIGFSPEPNTMRGADIHRCASDLNPPCSDLRAFDVGLPPFDTTRGGTDDITTLAYSQVNGLTTAMFSRKLVTGDPLDNPIPDADIKIIFATHPTSTSAYHGPTRAASVTLNFVSYQNDPAPLNTAAVIGGSIGGAVALLLLILLIVFICLWIFRDTENGLMNMLPPEVTWQFRKFYDFPAGWVSKGGGSANATVYFKKITSQEEKDYAAGLLKMLSFGDLNIKAITAIVNPVLIQNFAGQYAVQQSRLGNLAFSDTKWKAEKNAFQDTIYSHFLRFGSQFTWNQPGKPVIIPTVHGTDSKVGLAICETGFANLSSVDEGYYAKGIYFTTKALYAIPYFGTKRNPAILISWVLPGNVYPVWQPHNDSAVSLCGKSIKSGYQSHYALTQHNGKVANPQTKTYFDELVIPQESQIVPVYLVEVGGNLVKKAQSFQKRFDMQLPEVIPDYTLTDRGDLPSPTITDRLMVIHVD